jgi:hypothetical protein
MTDATSASLVSARDADSLPVSMGTLVMSSQLSTHWWAALSGKVGLTSDSGQFVCHRIECAQRG